MVKDRPPLTEAEEFRNTAEILRDLAAQVRSGNTRNELVNLADKFDRLAARAERENPRPQFVPLVRIARRFCQVEALKHWRLSQRLPLP
jgi:hypothetical protein